MLFNSIKVNNSELKDYFEVIGVLPRKEYLNRYNTNIAHVGQDGFVRLLTSVNRNGDTIYKWCQDENSEKNKDNLTFNITLQSNEMKDYLQVFDRDENTKLTLDPVYNSSDNVCALSIEENGAELEINAVNEYDFEYPSQESRKTEIYLDANEFVNGVENVIKSIATQETHMPTITTMCVTVDKKNNTIELACIDGFRLNTKKINVDGIYRENEGTEQFLIKQCTVQSMLKMIKKIKSLKKKNFNPDLTLTFTDTTVFCFSNGYFLNSKLMEGNFFDYNSIHLKEKRLTVKTDRDSLLKELKRVDKIKQDKQNLVKLDFFGDSNCNGLYISAQNETARMNIDFSDKIKEFEGEGLTIGFNTKYLIQAIEKLDRKQEISLSFNRPIDAIQIEYTDKNNNTGLNEVLPVRLVH